jgi:hypothetical protein
MHQFRFLLIQNLNFFQSLIFPRLQKTTLYYAKTNLNLYLFKKTLQVYTKNLFSVLYNISPDFWKKLFSVPCHTLPEFRKTT